MAIVGLGVPWLRHTEAKVRGRTIVILGLSVPAFTLLHVIISLIGIGAGVAALLGMAGIIAWKVGL